ncbi:Muskelin N-terminus-domain-containing protein [Leucosporidium creatinivorum]|uniref:Muskelin N-terminus-domain-containing protein n=1 Tax=Leucosporidium creatinivorum TaxID=106004 RepID=A0A1Y2G1C3_9BASI|nr:Muskelin N-terminus-domain-containing protein [Leucosporidium creatinivorum]
MASNEGSGALPPPSVLPYTIHSSSGHTASFRPTNILVDNPSDQSSRWTGATSKASDERELARQASSAPASAPASGSSTPREGQPKKKRETQYIIMELENPAIVTGIGFGKYCKTHPCNLFEFSLYGGLSPQKRYMEPILHGGLRNDAQKELFTLRIETGRKSREVLFPVKYLRIEAHSAHTQNYNVSIWHIWLEGVASAEHVQQALKGYEAYRLTYTTHLMLSHLRRTSPAYLSAFSTVLNSSPTHTSTTFEHPLLSHLHATLVVRGQFDQTEALLEESKETGLFREWCSGGGKGKNIGRWEQIAGSATSGAGEAGSPTWPAGRGGHQMVRVGRKILLFGGWDGERDLGDLWEYELPLTSTSPTSSSGGWRCLHPGDPAPPTPLSPPPTSSTDDEPRPRGRSCHQMAVDERTGWVYLLGAKLGPEEEEEWAAELKERESRAESSSTTSRLPPSTIPHRMAPSTGPLGPTMAGAIPIPPPTGEPRSRASTPGAAAPTSNGATTTNGGGGDAMDVEEEVKPSPSPAPRVEKRDPFKADFWRYKAVGPGRGKWELLCEDTGAVGGPKLLFDHQMFVHSQTQRLFVFGGKNQHLPGGASDDSDDRHSGMFCYDIQKGVWSHLFGDPTSTDTFRAERLLSRFGHSMLYDERASTIYVFSGQRGDTYLSDMWAIKISSVTNDEDEEEEAEDSDMLGGRQTRLWRAGAVIDALHPAPAASSDAGPSPSAPPRQPTILSISQLSSDYSLQGPAAAFTQRASLDPETREWTLLSGLIKDRKTGREVATDEVWCKTKDDEWEEVEVRGSKPVGRFAAQVVYDPLRKEHYMFGGNPSSTGAAATRLNDFWRLRVICPSPEEALRKAKFLVRKQRFTEMCQTRPTLVALHYLQNTLAAVVDHTDLAEASSFRLCMTALLSAPASNNCEVPMMEDGSILGGEDVEGSTSSLEGEGGAGGGGQSAEKDEELYQARMRLFEELLEFVPEEERQPKDDLRDLAMHQDMLCS